MSKFRPVDFWKASITTLPDNSFYELFRTVFGKIKTPFNKQALLGDLEKFLGRKDIKKNLAAYIDEKDILIISAIAAMDDPSQEELETFFAGEISYAVLQDLIINLEERFIVYRFASKEQNRVKMRLSLNPVLESVLLPFVESDSVLTGRLFPSAPIDKDIHANLLIDDRILAALLSFVSQNKLFFRMGGGGIRQKTINAAKTVFPNMQMDIVIGGLQILGLCHPKEEALLPDYQRFIAFDSISRKERLIYCAAGIWCHLDTQNDSSSSPWTFRSHVRSYAETINGMYNLLEPNRMYLNTTLQRMSCMLKSSINSSNVIEIMKKTGLIVQAADDYWCRFLITDEDEDDASAARQPHIAMDTPFTMVVYPGIPYNDIITIAAFSDVVEAGTTVRFEISRDSAVKAFNSGISAETIVELLKRLSNDRVDENLLFTLRDWEKRHGEVALQRGLVLTLAPEQRHLVETRLLSKLITLTLAPGIYMLPEASEEKAVEALHKAGVSIISRPTENHSESFASSVRSYFSPLSNGTSLSPAKTKKSETKAADTNAGKAGGGLAANLIDEFQAMLGKTAHAKEEKKELEARINRRLILCESQLHDAVIRYEKLEASGLDYIGKTAIAKQAISTQLPVEVTLPGKNKQQEKIFGVPKALEKTGSESILVIDTQDGILRLSLGKISLLRRIKKSIFEV